MAIDFSQPASTLANLRAAADAGVTYVTGTTGFNLIGVHITLDPDLYTDFAMGLVNTAGFTRFTGTLDANGLATASLNVPTGLPPIPFTVYHAYVVFDNTGRFHMASNAVPLRLR